MDCPAGEQLPAITCRVKAERENMSDFDVQVLLPVHNEAESIEATIREIHAELSRFARVQFILCEDGSKDNTQEVLRRVAEDIPAKLLLSTERKGYSRAVRDGMLAMDAPWLLCLDSDGQCDPKDFQKFWENRSTADVLIGWRVNRADNWMRKSMSRVFFGVWKAFYNCPINDPSCPYMLAPLRVIHEVAPRMGAMQQGYWWEFMARVHRMHFSIREFPVNHRDRAAGVTQVYRLNKLPGIGYRHFMALFQILRETRMPAAPGVPAAPGRS
jgi:dolichol-phosphate mannosyltransferase